MRWSIRIVILAAVAGIGVLGWRQFREFRQHRMIARARAAFEQKDYQQAMISARRALQMNPRDVAVMKMMVELSEKAKTKEALYWHRMLCELEPGIAENDIAWADSALQYKEVAIAEQALGRVDEAGRKTAAFHGVAGRLALAANQLPVAESHFAEAASQQPDNARYAVDLAALRIRSDDTEKHDAALRTLDKFIAEPSVRQVAARALLGEYVREKNWDGALKIAQRVQAAPEATFGDRMLYLGLLRRFQRPEFGSYLLEVQEYAAANPDDAAALITWLADNTLVMIAVSWAKTLPPAMASQTPVPAALGECYASLRDWGSLKVLVTDADWKFVNFLRLAFLARVQREEGDLLASRGSWTGAVKATGERYDRLFVLIRYASKWGWEAEAIELLWIVARGNSAPQMAIAELYRRYSATQNTRGLLTVSNRMLEIDPKDVTALNNVVILSLLLNSNVERAQALADDAFRIAPTNPGVISTYAYALHIRGKTDDGIALMRSLDERQFFDPSVAAYFASMLVDSSHPEEAAKFIETAQNGKILPEEMNLVKEASEKIARRNAAKRAIQ